MRGEWRVPVYEHIGDIHGGVSVLKRLDAVLDTDYVDVLFWPANVARQFDNDFYPYLRLSIPGYASLSRNTVISYSISSGSIVSIDYTQMVEKTVLWGELVSAYDIRLEG